MGNRELDGLELDGGSSFNPHAHIGGSSRGVHNSRPGSASSRAEATNAESVGKRIYVYVCIYDVCVYIYLGGILYCVLVNMYIYIYTIHSNIYYIHYNIERVGRGVLALKNFGDKSVTSGNGGNGNEVELSKGTILSDDSLHDVSGYIGSGPPSTSNRVMNFVRKVSGSGSTLMKDKN